VHLYCCFFFSVASVAHQGRRSWGWGGSDITILMSVSSKQIVFSNQCLCCYTALKLLWPKTKLQNVGANDPPSKIVIDGVPVEGVQEFIYLGSKQSSNGYC